MTARHCMAARAVISVFCAAALTACDSQSVDTTPADYERAKADCASHGGLQNVTTMLVMFHPDRVDATCINGVRISRDLGAGSAS